MGRETGRDYYKPGVHFRDHPEDEEKRNMYSHVGQKPLCENCCMHIIKAPFGHYKSLPDLL